MPHSNRSDIWSLECVLYELSTLKHPFRAKIWKHLALKKYKGYYDPLSSDYSYELHKVDVQASTILARKCLAKCNGQSSLPKEDGTYAGNKNGCSEAEAISKSLEPKKTSLDQKELHRRKDKLDSLSIIKDLKEVYDEVAQQ
ncbi:putative Serine-threonine-protein, partial [Naja naja]